MCANQVRTSTSGRRANRQRSASTTAATIVVTPIGVNHRLSPAYGMKIWPQVRSRCRNGGWAIVIAPPTTVTTAATSPIQSGRPRERAVAKASPPASCRIVAARTSATTRLTTKMPCQSVSASTTAPNSGPSTLPSSCTAETMPSGTPRRSAG